MKNDMNEEKQKKLEKSVNRQKLFNRIKIGITLFIVIGLIVYLYAVYAAASSLTIEDKSIRSLHSTGSINEYEATLVLEIKNPTSTAIEIHRFTYKAYLDDNFVGEGEKSYFSINPYTTITIPYSVTQEISGIGDGDDDGIGDDVAPQAVLFSEPVPAGLNSASLS